jgi:glycosyltransferase involved in cell wall biosynthesis
VQLGHAEKEAGDFDASYQAYTKARRLPGSDGDPSLHLGHLAKVRGDLRQAKQSYLDALRENPQNEDARRELDGLRHDSRAFAPTRARDAERLCAEERARLTLARESGDQRPSIVFDVSDLLGYFEHSRLPTGIQRVQMEVIGDALGSMPQAQICCFADDGDSWLRIPAALFGDVCSLALRSGDMVEAAWMEVMETLAAVQQAADPVHFERNALLVNLGTSWWLQNYFLHVREAKRRHGIRYVPFVHDFIPVMTPEHCVEQLTQDFLSWTFGVFEHADYFLTNSQATRDDLLTVAGILGCEVPPDRIAVIPLDADFRRKDRPALSAEILDRWSLASRSYVLFVSTVESRKNHVLAFEAWLDLIARHGAEAVPPLVCVGNSGWLNDRVYAMLADHPELAGKVTMLARVSDDALALLYEHCLITIYPSTYEGWGLPVTESLCHGKVPLVSHCSSLPEAGGEFAVYFAPGDRRELVAQLERLLFDADFRSERETRVTHRFRPRSWRDVATQIEDELARFLTSAGAAPPAQRPAAALGRYYPLRRNRKVRLQRHAPGGEQFRDGTGWWAPENWGCWTKAGGGLLSCTVPADVAEVECYVRLVGLPQRDCRVELAGAGRSESVTLIAGQWRWAAIRLRAETGRLELKIRSADSFDLHERSGFRDRRRIGVGVGGFILCDAADFGRHLAVARAVALDTYEEEKEDETAAS